MGKTTSKEVDLFSALLLLISYELQNKAIISVDDAVGVIITVSFTDRHNCICDDDIKTITERMPSLNIERVQSDIPRFKGTVITTEDIIDHIGVYKMTLTDDIKQNTGCIALPKISWGISKDGLYKKWIYTYDASYYMDGSDKLNRTSIVSIDKSKMSEYRAWKKEQEDRRAAIDNKWRKRLEECKRRRLMVIHELNENA